MESLVRQHLATMIQASSTATTEAEAAARQQLANMIQGLPLLSVLPTLQRLSQQGLSVGSAVGSGTASASSLTNNNIPNSGLHCVCGIRFSSVTNLEAHRMFYCTQRPMQSDAESNTKELRTSQSSLSPRGGDSLEDEDNVHVLLCPHCPYTTMHKLSLNGHMNMHTNPEEVGTKDNVTPKIATVVPPTPMAGTGVSCENRTPDRYCSDCDIQFSSVKTYRVHKVHYCQTRHVLKGSKSPARDDPALSIGNNSAFAAAAAAMAVNLRNITGGNMAGNMAGSLTGSDTSGQPLLALPTNPVLLVPYSLVIGAQLLSPQCLAQASGAAMVLPNGQVQPLSSGGLCGPPSVPPALLSPPQSSTVTQQQPTIPRQISPQASPTLPSVKEISSINEVSKEVKCSNSESSGKRRGEAECPLDLTTKRPKLSIKTDLMSDEEKENREVNTPTLTKSPSSKSRNNSDQGEFEGKLLASPPRPSPSASETGNSTPRSPRPASAAPTLGSPRALAESPRPSTSARSPVQQQGYTPSSLPQLPPGFPNLLAKLESLGNLSSMGSLQGIPPELILKLLNPELLMNGLNPIINPQVIVKQGEAKCNECNIVFYKEESLQVHKKHYCAARKTDEDSKSNGIKSPGAATDSNTGPAPRSPSSLSDTIAASSHSSSSISSIKEAQKPNKTMLQFICTACGIKFTSPDNLAAHQTYYCPKREGAGGEEGVTKGLWRCPRCRCAMPETLQAAHQCVTPTPSPSHGWKCPCCPVVSPTAASAQKHLETHAGIKAFRCTICGYRGNTLRGMRTHIRMHFEKRTNDLQEENFIACILEDEDGFRRGGESRSIADLPRVILENPTLSALLANDASVSTHTEQPMSCHFCPFATHNRGDFIRHLALMHKVDFTPQLQAILQRQVSPNQDDNTIQTQPSGQESQDFLENNTAISPPPMSAIKLEPEVKLEVDEDELAKSNSSSPSLSHQLEDDRLSSSAASSDVTKANSGCSIEQQDVERYCKACNITFSYLDSFQAHKRFYCTKAESTTPPETAVQ
ncbi:unnamed protein product [Meganyctiphanes norvegica]|uniref:Zinc finger protein ush n=1 Tax=Meganyctiphanes norvegica TaxID=48144 RepID=A0AAV2RQS3_MEGNR